MKKKFMFPLDIQLFADDNSGDGSGNDDDQGTGQDNQDSGEGGQEKKLLPKKNQIKSFKEELLKNVKLGKSIQKMKKLKLKNQKQ